MEKCPTSSSFLPECRKWGELGENLGRKWEALQNEEVCIHEKGELQRKMREEESLKVQRCLQIVQQDPVGNGRHIGKG